MGDVAEDLARCDREIERCWNHVCEPGDWLGAVMGWADWSIEKRMIREQANLH